MNPEFQNSTKQTAINQVDVASDFTRAVSLEEVGGYAINIMMSGNLAIRKAGLEERDGESMDGKACLDAKQANAEWKTASSIKKVYRKTIRVSVKFLYWRRVRNYFEPGETRHQPGIIQ